MKRNSLVILTAVLVLNTHSTLKASASETVPLKAHTPIYISQTSVQQSRGDRTSSNPNQGAGSVTLVLGLLVLLAIGAGAWILRSRSQTHPAKDSKSLVSEQPLPPVAAQKTPFVAEEIIPVQEVQDLPQDIVSSQKDVQDVPEAAVVTEAAIAPDLSELPLKLEMLQAAIESAKQKFQNLSKNLEQEIAHQVQVLPESILDQVSPELFSTQQQALEKLEVLQGVCLDLELPADAYFKQGNALFNAQRYEDAIAHYDKAINLNPDSAFAWFNTAYIYAVRGDKVKSLRYLKQSIHLNPDCLTLVHQHPEFDVVREELGFQE